MSTYSKLTNKVFKYVLELSSELETKHISNKHLVVSLIKNADKNVKTVLKMLNLNADSTVKELKQQILEDDKKVNVITENDPVLTVQAQDTISCTKMYCEKHGCDEIEPVAFFIGIITQDEVTGEYLFKNVPNDVVEEVAENVTEYIIGVIASVPKTSNTTVSYSQHTDYEIRLPKNIVNYFDNVHQKVAEKDYNFLRDKYCDNIYLTLGKKNNNNVLLIGNTGVGKKETVFSIVQSIMTKKCPSYLYDKKVIELRLKALLTGTGLRGDLEQRMHNIVNFFKRNKDYIIFIDNINIIFDTEITGLYECFIDFISCKDINIIATCNYNTYKRKIESDNSVISNFVIYTIDVPDNKECEQIVKQYINEYSDFHKVMYEPNAINTTIEICKKYNVSKRDLPSSVFDVLDECGCYINNASTDIKVITKELVQEVCAQKTGLPVNTNTNIIPDLNKLKTYIKNNLIGQEHCVETVVDSLARFKTGLQDENRPIGSFIFTGPTGVGKTHLAQLMCEYIFGDKKYMLRLDMSEYKEKGDVTKLLGAPPGYIGYTKSNPVLEFVDKYPFSLILFDEIEKAHSDIFDIFLQVLDNGEVKDSSGKVLDFRHCILVFTSNIGSELSNKTSVGFNSTYEVSEKEFYDKLKNHFRPEFINRFDNILKFNHLTKQDIEKIIELNIRNFNKRLHNKHKSRLTVTKKCKQMLVDMSYDTRYGARNLKRNFEKNVETLVADHILSNEEIKQRMKIDLIENKITVK